MIDNALLEPSGYYYKMNRKSSEINSMVHHKTWRYNLVANGIQRSCFHCLLEKTCGEPSPTQELWAGLF